MKTLRILLSTLLIVCSSTLCASSNTFLDYQNYNHGYCPDCECSPCKCGSCPEGESTCPAPDPCCPPATSCATECGLNIWYVGIGLAVIAAAGAILIGSNNGSVSSHSGT